MSGLKRFLPNDSYLAAHPNNANAPSDANPFATIADLPVASGDGIYDGSGGLTGGATTVTGIATDVLHFSGSTTKMSYTSGGKTITSGVGTNPIGFGTVIGDLNYLQLGTTFDAFGGLFEGGNGEPVFQGQVYDAATFVEQACIFAGVDDFAGTDRPYSAVYYTTSAGATIGFQSDVNGEQIYTQRLGLASTALAGTEGIVFVNATGYLKAATIADLATFIVDGNGIYDGSGSIPAATTATLVADFSFVAATVSNSVTIGPTSFSSAATFHVKANGNNGTYLDSFQQGATSYILKLRDNLGIERNRFGGNGNVELSITGNTTYIGNQANNYFRQALQESLQFSNAALYTGFHANRSGNKISMRATSANGVSMLSSTGNLAMGTNWNGNFGSGNLINPHILLHDSSGNVAINAATTIIVPSSKLTIYNGDAEVTGSINGFIAESPDGTRYRATMLDGGIWDINAV